MISESKSHISLLTVHSGWLYWLDREINQLERIELKTGRSRSPVLNGAYNIVDIISVTPPDTNHPCLHMNTRKCSHLCIMNGTYAMCSCPHDQALQADSRSCTPLEDCGPNHFTCSTHSSGNKDCIPVAWRCDQQMDCPDKSDERDCHMCMHNQFKCKNSQCINQGQVCDGIPNCSDGSDEERCCKTNQFRCPKTDVCISITLVCDGIEHCADGEDEMKSTCSGADR